MKALVLCGGIPQIALIEDLKSRGITTILLDMNEKAVARKYADKYYPTSVFDVDEVRKIAVMERVDFIITACADQVLLVVAGLSEELSLPCYIDYSTAKNVSDKSYMKNIFAKNGIPSSKYITLDRLDAESVMNLEYPLIVKPVDSYSSRGIRRVQNYAELTQAFNDAVNISKKKTAIVEEFVVGKELSVDVYVENGKAHVLCVSQLDKIPDTDRFVINRCVFPAPISEKEMGMVAITVQKIAEAFVLSDTPMLVQLITTGDKISILEFCSRAGGGNKFRLIKKATGFDIVRAVVDLTLGIKPHYSKTNSENKYIIDEFLYCVPGIFDHLEGFKELKDKGIINEYYLLKQKGVEVKDPTNSSDRIAYFTIQTDDYELLREKYNILNKTIKAIDNNGNDLIRHDLIESFWK